MTIDDYFKLLGILYFVKDRETEFGEFWAEEITRLSKEIIKEIARKKRDDRT